MSELERDLRALAAAIDWPATPEPALPAALPQPDRRLRRPLVVAIALLAVAVAVAFAVPGARSAILRFFGVGGVTVERVQTLPPARTQPLEAALGAPITRSAAEAELGAPVRLPRSTGRPQLYVAAGVVSALVDTGRGEVLVSQLRSLPAGALLKKIAPPSTRISAVAISADTTGYWLSGAQHVVIGPATPPRLAGDVLLFDRDGITYRLEGPRLTREGAVALARQMLR